MPNRAEQTPVVTHDAAAPVSIPQDFNALRVVFAKKRWPYVLSVMLGIYGMVSADHPETAAWAGCALVYMLLLWQNSIDYDEVLSIAKRALRMPRK